MKYKVGDKVRIRSDLHEDESYGGYAFSAEMESYRGKIAIITFVGNDYYVVDCDLLFAWTDEMFEPVEEMSAIEALKTIYDLCEKHLSCKDCPIQDIDNSGVCYDIKRRYPEKVVEVLKQWKADHEKNPIETENAMYIVVMDEKRNAVYEEKTNEPIITSAMKEEALKKYCSEHDGKYYAICERRCVVKE